MGNWLQWQFHRDAHPQNFKSFLFKTQCFLFAMSIVFQSHSPNNLPLDVFTLASNSAQCAPPGLPDVKVCEFLRAGIKLAFLELFETHKLNQ